MSALGDVWISTVGRVKSGFMRHSENSVIYVLFRKISGFTCHRLWNISCGTRAFFTILKYPTSKSRVVQWLPLRGSDNNLGFGSINLGFPDNKVPI